MEPIKVDWWICDTVKKMYPRKKIYDHLYKIRSYNRYIQFSTSYERDLSSIHFEVCPDGFIQLHFEGEHNQKIADLSQFLYQETRDDERFVWYSNDIYELGVCRYDEFLGRTSQLVPAIEIFVQKIDSLCKKFKESVDVEVCDNYDLSFTNKLTEQCENDVSLFDNLTLEDIIHLNINIPEYQRIYCWQEKNVRQLLDDITNFNGTYRMGTIILHHHDKTFDIIDGQQRLVTLSLILRKLGYKHSPLLNLRFKSSEATQYVAYNRFVIDNYINSHITIGRADLANKLLKFLEFSALVINTDKIDLAYTFFSNENSRGKSLSDFDLLKAHHLRYVTDYAQAEHLAKNWDAMLTAANKRFENNSDKPYYRSLGLYLFRLRKWLYNESWDDFAPYKIKYEYEAAPIIDEIPPFGEKFQYNEAIQGGSHFFAFVRQYEYRFNMFAQTSEYVAIHNIDGRTHWWFRDVIETFMFAYYLKFGTEYLSEALVGISRIVLQYRYDYAKANYERLLEKACHSGILAMIDRATSPTFVLADLVRQIRNLPSVQPNLKPIAREFQRLLKNSLSSLKKNHIVINEFKRIL